MTWLDSLDLNNALDSLALIHAELPSDNTALTMSGVYSARGQYSDLATLADNEIANGDTPELFQVIKHYADVQQNTNWTDSSNVDRAWLMHLGAQRDIQGSALANAWLHALGDPLPEEIIVMPTDQPKSLSVRHDHTNWESSTILEAFPNPSNGPIYVVAEIQDGMEAPELRITDLFGRELSFQKLQIGQNIVELQTKDWSSGSYVAFLKAGDASLGQVKLVVQK